MKGNKPMKTITNIIYLAFALFALACFALAPQALSADARVVFENTGRLATQRYGHTATLLPNGKVLIAGGFNNDIHNNPFGCLSSAELYDPASGTWSTTGSLNTAREGHTAALLPNGMVLVAGGYGCNAPNTLASAEIYDPATGIWSTTGSLATGRIGHTATLLPNGKVLVAGGASDSDGVNVLSGAELYDSVSGTWTATGSLLTGRAHHTATSLLSGKVLVAGGYHDYRVALASAELYDPASGTWSTTGSLNTARLGNTMTLLSNGQVLVACGGYPDTASAELYDPAGGIWSTTGSLNTGRLSPTATLTADGKVLVAGGYNYGTLATAELFDLASGTWSFIGHLVKGRYDHTTTLLTNGEVLVAAGLSNFSILASAELGSYRGP